MKKYIIGGFYDLCTDFIFTYLWYRRELSPSPWFASSFLLGIIITKIRTKDKRLFSRILKEIDIPTLLLLSGLFIVVAGITEAGLVEEISKIFIRFSGDNLFIMYTLVVWVSFC